MRTFSLLLLSVFLSGPAIPGQTTPTDSNTLRAILDEVHKLRQDLQATRALLERPADQSSTPDQTAANLAPASATPTAAVTQATTPDSIEEKVQKLEDTTSLIGSKIDEQYQTKIESGRARCEEIDR